LDWDEMEAEAAIDDKRKRIRGEDVDEEPAKKSRRSASNNGNKRRR
jgi:hypothetical protein